MENNKSFKVMAIVALCVSVIGVSVAFASLSQDLTIEGNGMVDPITWDIHFENMSEEPVLVGSAEVMEGYGIDEDDPTKIYYDFVFKAPGDSYSIEFDVVNAGDLNAEITNVLGGDVEDWTYDPMKVEDNGEGGTILVEDTRETGSADATLVMENLIFTLTYEDGTEVKMGDTLEAGANKTMVLTVTYNEDANDVPTGMIKIKPNDLIITYTQSIE